ncbi:MAG: DNA-methyltransferase [Pyrinomonadaceae bacterium]
MLETVVKTEPYKKTHNDLSYLNKIVCGDSAKLIRQIPDESVDLVITSPPYFKQRDYGAGLGNEKTCEEYVENLLRIFRDCVRITKKTGSIIFNLGDKYEAGSLLLVPYRFAIRATENFEVKLVNAITWVKSNPTPRQFKRRLVSSTEPFFHFVKSENYHYFVDEFLKPEETTKTNAANGNVGKTYFDLIEKSELTDEQKNKARAALIEIIGEVRSRKIQGFRMKIRGIHSEPFGGQDGGRKIQLDKNGFTLIRIHGNPLKKDVIVSPVESLKNAPHPAIYPTAIVGEFLNLLTEKGDIVLDPFIGSGSTAVAAIKKQRNFIGFDINPNYCEYARKRIADAINQQKLF